LHTVPALIFYFDSHNKVIRANRAAGLAMAKSADELVGCTLDEIFPQQADEMITKNSQVIASGQPLLGEEMVYQHANGEVGWATVDRLPYREEDGQTLGVIVFMNDISDRRHRDRELQALVSIAGALRSSMTQAEMWPVILEQVITLINAQGALIARLDEITQEIIVDYGMGDWFEMRGQRFPPGMGVTAITLQTGQPYLNNDNYNDPLLVRQYFIKELKSSACLPLISHDQVTGVQTCALPICVLIGISDIAANALYRASLFDQTQLRLKRLAGLHSIDMAITSSLDQRLIMDLLLDQVTSQLQADGADVLLFHEDTNRLEYSGGKGKAGNNPKRRAVRLGDGLVGRMPIDRRAIHLPDVAGDQGEDVIALLKNLREPVGAYFAAPLVAKGKVKGVLEVFQAKAFSPDSEWLEFIETLATQAAIAIDNAELFDHLQHTNDELRLAYDATIEGWSRALDQRDHETQDHSERVTALTMELARRMGIPRDQFDSIRKGVLLHDIGKMAIPDSILLKAGKLTDAEWEIMRNHPVYAYNLLSPIPYLRASLDIPYAHHEHWDGSGYPRGLAGRDIPLAARMFSVVDVWDALISDRPYRAAWSEDRVKEYILSLAGIQFDPKVVEIFMQMIDDPDVLHTGGKADSVPGSGNGPTINGDSE
jgi:PAS domain S-box-containing protein